MWGKKEDKIRAVSVYVEDIEGHQDREGKKKWKYSVRENRETMEEKRYLHEGGEDQDMWMSLKKVGQEVMKEKQAEVVASLEGARLGMVT